MSDERAPGSPPFHSISGATTKHVEQDISQTIRRCSASQIVIHVGANDVKRKRSELVAKDIYALAEKTKRTDGVRQVFICSVTQRLDNGSFIFSRSESVNNRLRTFCSKAPGISFIDLRPKLDKCPFSGIHRDGLHYNRQGASQTLRSILEATNYFLA